MADREPHTTDKPENPPVVATKVSERAAGGDRGAPAFDPSAVDKKGAILDRRFRIERLLGKGGMGCVLAATHLSLDERVAIKVLQPGHAFDEKSRLRLLREARASVKIKSEHVVRVLDVVSEGQSPAYIVMEYLDGEDLAERLRRKGLLPIEEAVDIALQACEAIGEGHFLGIIHRDLKPSNLFLCAKPGRPRHVKVLDFGISKLEGSPIDSITHTQTMLGSPAYAPPEQLQAARNIDQRVDVWSMGVILYEATTGRLPFVGQTLAQVCTQILHGSPTPPRELRPEIPEALEQTILRCLEKEPFRRFGSIESLVFALRDHAKESGRACLEYLEALRFERSDRSTPPPPLGARCGYEQPAGLNASTQRAMSMAKTGATAGRRRALGAWGLLLAAVAATGWVVARGYGLLGGTSAIAPAPSMKVLASPSAGGVPANTAPAALSEPSRSPPPPLVSAEVGAPEPVPSKETSPPPRPERIRAPTSRPSGGSKPAPRSSAGGGARDPDLPWVDSR